jgi:proline-rich protein PRCC
MLGLVNYGSSDSENEVSDDEVEIPVKSNGTHKLAENIENDLKISQKLKFPQPRNNKLVIEEEEDDDEFLHKKATPILEPPKKEKVKIFIPKLSDFKDEDDDEDRKVKKTVLKKKNGLLDMLPKPSNSFAPAPKPKPSQTTATIPLKPSSSTTTETSSSNHETTTTKKIGLIPYSLMSHKPKNEDKKKKKEDSDSEDDEATGSFFSFTSHEDLPNINDDEVKALVEREKNRIEQRKRQHEEPEVEVQQPEINNQQEYYQQQETQIDSEAMRALLGGNKAKRSKIQDIQIIDLDAREVLPDKEEWMRKSLAGETSYIVSGKLDEKVRIFKIFYVIIKTHHLTMNFRDLHHSQNENIKFHIYQCVLKIMYKNLKQCGQQIDHLINKEEINTDFSLKSSINLIFT